NIGVQTNLPQGRIANNYVIQDTVTYLRGAHTFRAGFDLLDQRSRQFAPINERGSLAYSAGGGYSAFANFVDDFGGSAPHPRAAHPGFRKPRHYPVLFPPGLFRQDPRPLSRAPSTAFGFPFPKLGN